MIQMHMITGEQCPTFAQAAVSITNAVNTTLSSLQNEEDCNPEDIRRVETHLSKEDMWKWNGSDYVSINQYQYIAFIWLNE